MSARNSALASLTATYTDSENEDERDSHSASQSSSDTESPPPSTTTSPKHKPDKSPTVAAAAVVSSSKSARRLVSYNDDNVISDDENETVSPNTETVNMEISEEDETSQEKADRNKVKIDQFAEYGFSLPAEPKGKCPQDLQDKITNMYEKMKSGMDMNKLIQERKEFRNPSIYEKLIQYCDIDELGTNYQPEIYDPLQWGKESFFEELAKVQKTEMEKREKEKRENIKQELVLAAAKKAEEEAKKRKSKWDQPAPSATLGQTAPLGKPTSIPATIQPSITTNATGTKGTVISAFGSLPKKPKV
ncbi:SAP30-binding protein [Pseudolycoriella hygida]|uniref:SAP30-binding protein n=1 Tax=Pseudolycoriella hygida TaxID=35572 RepID=A0A9Q0S3Q5_9DIPT|nr:SAP30-binding protein [Pseudolycoriella hygida]